MEQGKVYLVGAGPGAVGLLTILAKKCIEQADVVVYDRLVNPKILQLASAEAEFIYAGKLPNRHVMRQEKINETLIQKSQEGKIVVRLKGGDPSVFGRVGEEAEALAKKSIPFEIIPGVTSSIAAATYAGIPVTHRDYGLSFAMVSGHDKSPSGNPMIDWHALATGVDTIAFYMGVGNIDYIASQLIQHGRNPDTPVILIQWGTYARQKTLEGSLRTIAERVKEVQFENPAITLVGNIVALREKIKWVENKPLFGQQLLLARTSNEESKVAERLESLGADVYHYPTFKQTSLLQQANKEIVKKLSSYEAMVFTSPDSIEGFFRWLAIHHLDIRSVRARFFVLSNKSLRKLREFGCYAEVVEEAPEQRNVLIIGERNVQPESDFLCTHENSTSDSSQIVIRRLLQDQAVSRILFPSTRSVEQFWNGVKELEAVQTGDIFHIPVICFGEKSAKAATTLGFTVDYMLEEPSSELLINYLMEKSWMANVKR